jgi:hypothetical protein
MYEWPTRVNEGIMYARVISFVVKPYQVRSFCDAIKDVTREIASRQEGFIEHLILISEEEKRLVTVISLCETKTAADRYHADILPSISIRLMPLIDSGPNISYCTVDSALKQNLGRHPSSAETAAPNLSASNPRTFETNLSAT